MISPADIKYVDEWDLKDEYRESTFGNYIVKTTGMISVEKVAQDLDEIIGGVKRDMECYQIALQLLEGLTHLRRVLRGEEK